MVDDDVVQDDVVDADNSKNIWNDPYVGPWVWFEVNQSLKFQCRILRKKLMKMVGNGGFITWMTDT